MKSILKSLLLHFILIYCSSSEILWAQSWTVKTPMPTKRAVMADATLDNDIYVFGGVTSVAYDVTDTVEAYSATTDSWRVCSSMPTPRGEMIAVTVGSKIYVIGGFNYESGALDIVEIYDPAIILATYNIELSAIAYSTIILNNTYRARRSSRPRISNWIIYFQLAICSGISSCDINFIIYYTS